jgi:nicotinate-nucleotide--dimethylbenzimidazole phosphoribosyltransferase
LRPQWLSVPAAAGGPRERDLSARRVLLIRVARPADPRAGSAWPAIQTAASIIPATPGPTHRGSTEPLIEILDLTDQRRIDRLDKHRLDIALSIGRHAAERARLAGARHLIALATGMTECLVAPTRSDPYERLRDDGQVEIAVLVGAAIACAQIGLQVSLPHRLGGLAAAMAIRLNPSISDWLTGDDDRPGRSTIARPSGVARVADDSAPLVAGDLVSAMG